MESHDAIPTHWRTDFARLCAVLHKAADGAMVIVLISVEDQEVETEVARLLQRSLAELRLSQFGFERHDPSLRNYLLRYAPSGVQIVLARGLHRLPDHARRTALQLMNQERDVLRQFGCSLVVFLTPEISPEFQRWAADFWDCSSGFLEFHDPHRQRFKTQLLEARQFYLRLLQQRSALLELHSVLPVTGGPQIDLEAVFVEPSVIVSREMVDVTENAVEGEMLLFRKLLKPGQRTVILGEPGAGKSILLRYIAAVLAQGPLVANQRLGIESDTDWFPILAPLSAYAAVLAQQPDIPFSDYLPQYLHSREFGSTDTLGPLLSNELQLGRCVVMLDGLDEIAAPGQRHEVIERILDFVHRFPDNTYLITSRIAGYERASVGEDFDLLTIGPLEWSQRQRLVRNWCKASLQPMSGSEENTDLASFEAERLANGLLAAIEREEYLLTFSSNPLLLTILINVYLRGESLPQRRGELYRIATAALTETWAWERSVSGRPVLTLLDDRVLDERRVVELLGPVAFWAHQTRPGGSITRHELLRRLADHMTRREGVLEERAWCIAEEFASLVQERVGLLAEREPEIFAFIHRTFQEYLAARYLATRRDINEQVCALLSDPNWEEVLVLLGDILQGEYFDDYVQLLLDTELSGQEIGQNILLAGRCLYSAGAHLTGTVLGQRVVLALAALVETPTIPFQRRLRCGEVLGNLGDPRVNQMVEVPAGSFIMGVTEDELLQHPDQATLKRSLERSAPVHQVFLPTFYIDRYPVTHAQYACFVGEGGYERPELWSAAGWEWLSHQRSKLPAYWNEYRWNRPNYPVIGVSWYEAEAYARWAGKRLPTEAEREKAARGTDARTWPWGNEWQDNAANAEAKLGQLTPVGIYPDGASPYGVMDMAGNVWEWTADWFAPYDAPEQQDKSLKVLRGGAWNSEREHLRCTMRIMSEPGARVGSVGFRCVRDVEDDLE